VADIPLKNHPKRWKWRVEWLAQTGLEKLAGLLPGRLVFHLGEAMGGLAWHLMRERRQIVLRNLRIAFYGEYDLPTLRKMARDTFRRTGANLFSALHSTQLSPDQISRIVTVENPELVGEALGRAAGLVTMPPHMGNWEILTRITRTFPPGYKAGAFYRPLNNPLLDQRVLAQREAGGTRLFSKRDSFHTVTGFLREGAIVGILADQRVGRQGELVRFFGRLTRASPLPALIARRSRSEVLAMSVITESPGKWRIRYHPLDGPIRTATCMEALERAMKASPTDVFWLQERWKVFVSRSRPLRGWLSEESHGTGKPHRALLWLADVPGDWMLPQEWTHPDVIYEIALAADQAKPSWLTGAEFIHRVSPNPTRKSLEVIDLSHALPLDYILTVRAPDALTKAAELESIPLVSLASTGGKMPECPPPADPIS
jgi:KDO2-lipid IV(A) lauroyltransferase